jgi:hypothetical protein
MEAFRDKCNASPEFKHNAKFADTKIVLFFGENRYFMKVYKGQIIDLEKFIPTFAPLGYDVCVRADMEIWEDIHAKKVKFWDHLNSWRVEIGGDHMDAHRLHEMICIMCADILPTI